MAPVNASTRNLSNLNRKWTIASHLGRALQAQTAKAPQLRDIQNSTASSELNVIENYGAAIFCMLAALILIMIMIIAGRWALDTESDDDEVRILQIQIECIGR